MIQLERIHSGHAVKKCVVAVSYDVLVSGPNFASVMSSLRFIFMKSSWNRDLKKLDIMVMF